MVKRKKTSSGLGLLLTAIVLIAVVIGVVAMNSEQSLFGRATVGRQFYVDSVSGNDSNTGLSSSSPWRSLAPVNAYAFTPGDTINFKRGSSYSTGLIISRSGSATAPITYQAYGTGDAPVFSRPPEVKWGKAIQVTGAWNIIDGFMMKDAHEAGVRIEPGGSHTIVRNSEATNVGIGVYIFGSDTIVNNVYVHDTKIIKNTQGGDDDYGGNGFWISAPNVEIAYSRCINAIAPSYDYGMDGGCIEISGAGDHAYIHHVYSRGSAGFLEFGSSTGDNERIEEMRLAYNVAIDNDESFVVGHLTGQNRFAVDLGKLIFENNTVIHRTKSNYALFQMDGNLHPGAIILRNNIFYSAIPVASRSDLTHENNLYAMQGGASVGYSLTGSEISGNPLFVNLPNLDLHLQAGSPAINRGLNLGYVTDFDQRNIPVGSGMDIGAYEYVSGAGDTASIPRTPAPAFNDQPKTPAPTPRATSKATPSPTQPPSTGIETAGVTVTYYNQPNFSGTQGSRTEKTINLVWNSSTDNTLGTALPPQAFSAEWNGYLKIPKTGNYSFTIISDDTSSLTLNNLSVLNKSATVKASTSKAYSFTAGEKVMFKMRYSNGAGPAQVELQWSVAGAPNSGIPATALIH